jgi:hypothetical protein
MDRERAEAYLRQVAETELRRLTGLDDGGAAVQWHSGRLALAAQVLRVVGAVDDDTFWEIQGELQLALATRQLSRPALAPLARQHVDMVVRIERARAADRFNRTPAYPAPSPSPSPSWRIVPAGQVIPADDDRRELHLLAYAQTPAGARFTAIVGMPAAQDVYDPALGSAGRRRMSQALQRLTATDDLGTGYQLRFWGGFGTGALVLRPDPPPGLRWLDVIPAPGEPGIRVDLDRPGPAAQVSVSREARGPGALMLDVVATRILTSTADFPPDDPEYLASAQAELGAFVGDQPGQVVAALRAADALTPDSRVPGQLAGLLGRLDVGGHGIAAPPDPDLPPRWESMLTRYHRREPYPVLTPGSWAASVAELPELDGVTIAVLGVHHGEPGTIVHTLVTGVTGEDDWEFMRGVRPLPALWVRDSAGRWHATRTSSHAAPEDSREVMVWLAVVPPLERGTAWIDLVATGASAEIRVRLPLGWR